VRCDDRGRIVVDEEYRTTAEGIYAAGDVIGPPALASVSSEQGRVAICHAFDIPFKEVIDPLPPYGVYSIPEVGMVGMTEEAAATAGIDYEVGRAWFVDNARSAIAGTQQGLIKLVLERDTKRLIGAHILGEEAAELIHQAQAVIHTRGTIDYFIDSTYNVPTRSEAFKYAAYDALQRLSREG
jgi:NAD(P) transhydrogenase